MAGTEGLGGGGSDVLSPSASPQAGSKSIDSGGGSQRTATITMRRA